MPPYTPKPLNPKLSPLSLESRSPNPVLTLAETPNPRGCAEALEGTIKADVEPVLRVGGGFLYDLMVSISGLGLEASSFAWGVVLGSSLNPIP